MILSRRNILVGLVPLALAALAGGTGGAPADAAAATCAPHSSLALRGKPVPVPAGWSSSAHGVDRHGVVAGAMWLREYAEGHVFTYAFRSGRLTDWRVPPGADGWTRPRDDDTAWHVGARHIVGTNVGPPFSSGARATQVFDLDRAARPGAAIRPLPIRTSTNQAWTFVGFHHPWAVGDSLYPGSLKVRAVRVDVTSPDPQPVELADPAVEVRAASGGVAVGVLAGAAPSRPVAVDLREAPDATVRPLTPYLEAGAEASYVPSHTNGRFVVGQTFAVDQGSVAPYWSYDLGAAEPRMFPLPLPPEAEVNGVKGHFVYGSTGHLITPGRRGFVVDLRSSGSPLRTFRSSDQRMGQVVGMYHGVVVGVSVDDDDPFGGTRFLGYDLRACTPRLVDLGPAEPVQTLVPPVTLMRGPFLIGPGVSSNPVVWRLSIDRH